MNAKDYKKLASAKRGAKAVIDVTVPSGGVWKMIEPPIQQFVMAGKLPASLAAKMAAAATGKDVADAGQEMLEKLTPEDLMQNLQFCRDLLLHCAVEPKIVIDADPDSETEIAPEDIDPEDFEFLIKWVMTGGKAGESLETFRSE